MKDDYFYSEFQKRFSTAQKDFPLGVGVEKSVRLANKIKLFTNTYKLRLWECPSAVLGKILRELKKEWRNEKKRRS